MIVFDRILTEFGPELLWLPGDISKFPKTAEMTVRPYYILRFSQQPYYNVRLRRTVSLEQNRELIEFTLTYHPRIGGAVTDASPVISYGSTLTGETGGISNVTHNGTTLVVTTDTAHGLSVGDTLIMYGVHGQLAANGTFKAATGTTGSTIMLQTTADEDIASSGVFVASPKAKWHKGIEGATEFSPTHVGNGVYLVDRSGSLPLKHQESYTVYCYESGNPTNAYTRIVRETITRR